jgi:hypothetical protein
MEASSSPVGRHQVIKNLLIYYFVQVKEKILCFELIYCLALIALIVRTRERKN